MSTPPIVEVWLWDLHIASLAQSLDASRAVTFRYTDEFLSTGYEVAPILMPASRQIFTDFNQRGETFKGLPPLVIDSLPDKFGEAIINQWIARQQRTEPLTPLERLCYVGARGMGALEYRPATPHPELTGEALDVQHLVELANEVVATRDGKMSEGLSTEKDFTQILSVGTSAGGARAKAVIAFNPNTEEVRSGQAQNLPDGFEHWLLKFDGVDGNRDNELADPQGYGRVEYAYWLMAIAAGIEMEECRLLEENGRAHFMTKRWDRIGANGKVHYQSLCAMGGYDFNQPRRYSYEDLFMVMRRIGLGVPEQVEMIRRCVFNIVLRNQDDHTKNFGFLLDQSSDKWRLSPAFDVTWSFNPTGQWTASHQLTLGGESDGWSQPELVSLLATASGEPASLVEGIVDQVLAVASRWGEFAAAAGVDMNRFGGVESTFRKFS